MKKPRQTFFVLILTLFICVVARENTQAQMGGPWRGYGGESYCPMCGQQWDGHYRDTLSLTETLPKPKSREWVEKLREVLSLEKLSKAQYQSDSDTYKVYMPYMRVIPQEENHIAWITKMFNAYGIAADAKVIPVEKSASLEKAYEHAIKLENDLIPRYEWLINKAEDKQSAEILNTILLQTRMHLVMFQHALQMGDGMGPGMMYR